MAANPPSSDTSASVSASEFMRHPNMVGSAFPATKRMVRRSLRRIDSPVVDVLVEYGPGTGRFTAAALAKLKRSSTLIAIETGEDFVEHLRSSLSDDDKLNIVHDSAADVLHILKIMASTMSIASFRVCHFRHCQQAMRSKSFPQALLRFILPACLPLINAQRD